MLFSAADWTILTYRWRGRAVRALCKPAWECRAKIGDQRSVWRVCTLGISSWSSSTSASSRLSPSAGSPPILPKLTRSKKAAELKSQLNSLAPCKRPTSADSKRGACSTQQWRRWRWRCPHIYKPSAGGTHHYPHCYHYCHHQQKTHPLLTPQK